MMRSFSGLSFILLTFLASSFHQCAQSSYQLNSSCLSCRLCYYLALATCARGNSELSLSKRMPRFYHEPSHLIIGICHYSGSLLLAFCGLIIEIFARNILLVDQFLILLPRAHFDLKRMKADLRSGNLWQRLPRLHHQTHPRLECLLCLCLQIHQCWCSGCFLRHGVHLFELEAQAPCRVANLNLRLTFDKYSKFLNQLELLMLCSSAISLLPFDHLHLELSYGAAGVAVCTWQPRSACYAFASYSVQVLVAFRLLMYYCILHRAVFYERVTLHILTVCHHHKNRDL